MTKRLYSNDDIGNGVIAASYADINAILAVGSRVVTSSSTALSLTATQHGEREVIWSPNSSGTATATLPAATGSGRKFSIRNGIAQTQGTLVITSASAGDVFKGIAKMFDTSAAADAMAFPTTATSVKVSLNRTTQGGLYHDHLIAIDVALNEWRVEFEGYGTGSIATPFSA